jgi:hypothetical protein
MLTEAEYLPAPSRHNTQPAAQMDTVAGSRPGALSLDARPPPGPPAPLLPGRWLASRASAGPWASDSRLQGLSLAVLPVGTGRPDSPLEVGSQVGIVHAAPRPPRAGGGAPSRVMTLFFSSGALRAGQWAPSPPALPGPRAGSDSEGARRGGRLCSRHGDGPRRRERLLGMLIPGILHAGGPAHWQRHGHERESTGTEQACRCFHENLNELDQHCIPEPYASAPLTASFTLAHLDTRHPCGATGYVASSE